MIGTLEFRQALGAVDAQGCVPWVELVHCFARAALKSAEPTEILKYSADAEGLKLFIGEYWSAVDEDDIVEPIFRGVLRPTPVRDLSDDDWERFMRQQEAK